jgi:histidine kinase
MASLAEHFQRKLAYKLVVTVGLTLLVAILTWAYFNIDYQRRKLMEQIIEGTDRLTSTIRLGTHYAMMLNSRDDINQIITNISRLPEITIIRIYNKQGEIKFSSQPLEVDSRTNIEAEACFMCHRSQPPLTELRLEERVRFFDAPGGYRLLGIISPIRNEPGCASESCHIHPSDKQILGALDVVVSLKRTDSEILTAKQGLLKLALFVFALTSGIVLLFVFRLVNRPIRELIAATHQIAGGKGIAPLRLRRPDELGQLAEAIQRMGEEIGRKQDELNKQRDEYLHLFEGAPCLITVQDRELRLLRYNQEFATRFETRPGEFCYTAYKGREEKCENCPVEKTFADGLVHSGEAVGLNKDGSSAYWIFRTSPVRSATGEIVAAMEMSLDITQRKLLEVQLRKSEQNYHEIFNHIPNPVFVLNQESLLILDCNISMEGIYEYERRELIQRSFLMLFPPEDQRGHAELLRSRNVIHKAVHVTRSGRRIFVAIRKAPSEYYGQPVFLVITSDITQRLETEQQLIQAGKMATLGEMATGIAHELNQPLSVIKTVSSFFIRKIERREAIEESTLHTMLGKVDRNVDRASKIITHMRQFARKSDVVLETVDVVQVMQRACDIFSQQLKVRGITLRWQIAEGLPSIQADPDRLEQVFINLLLNARDAIEEKWGHPEQIADAQVITLKAYREAALVRCEVCDSGAGIPEAVADRIFEPFFTTKEVGKGTGLGLSISYGIIKECNGHIWVRKGVSDGACFVVDFPVPVPTTHASDSGQEEAGGGTDGDSAG